MEQHSGGSESQEIRIPAASDEVFSWPEYKALASRLGIPEVSSIQGISITLQRGHMVQVHHTYLGTKVKPPARHRSMHECDKSPSTSKTKDPGEQEERVH